MPPSSDPQLLSKVLRTKLGLGWDPQWDQPDPRMTRPIPQAAPQAFGAIDPLISRPGGYAPMPSVNEAAMLRARMQAPDMERRLPLAVGPTM